MRKAKKQLVQRILQFLDSPMTINELSEKIGSNWDTIKEAIDLLKSIHMIESYEEDNKKLFKKIKGNNLVKREDTLFGILLNKEVEELCKFLFIKIKQKWKEKTGQEPNRTQMQKVVAEIADNTRLPVEIPRGWYIFAKMCILEY